MRTHWVKVICLHATHLQEYLRGASRSMAVEFHAEMATLSAMTPLERYLVGMVMQLRVVLGLSQLMDTNLTV